jgi:hypothetical protein
MGPYAARAEMAVTIRPNRNFVASPALAFEQRLGFTIRI